VNGWAEKFKCWEWRGADAWGISAACYGSKAAQHYGSIRSALEKRGQTIGVNDLHIAAHARSEGLTLVSNNLREFERVDALQWVNWAV
jgi:tRNA(fMet)-specific endonuclease VapC